MSQESATRTMTPTKQILAGMNQSMTAEELAAWRVAPVERPSADERNLPSEYPFGWYGIGFGKDIEVGEVKAVRYFAKELVMWRGEDGQVRVLDAYCPHYGAHLGHGGVVKGNLIECPYHAWKWDETGAAKEVPYAERIPILAQQAGCIPSWPVRELNGHIWMWYHPDKAEPLWEPAKFEEVDREDYTDFLIHEWNIYTGFVNFADNAVDLAHFQYLHGTQNLPDADIELEGIKRTIIAKVQFDTPKGPVAGTIESSGYGPSQGLVQFKGISETLVISTLTPIDRDHLKVWFAFTQPKSEAEGPRANLARALIADLCKQVDQDKIVLDHSCGLDRPLICDGDGPLAQNRRFMGQFFVKNAPSTQARE